MTTIINKTIPNVKQPFLEPDGQHINREWNTFLTLLASGGTPQTPTGPAGGDLTGTYPNPDLVPTGVTASTYGTSTMVFRGQVDSNGRIVTAANVAIDFPVTSVSGTAPITVSPTTGAPVVSLNDTAVTPATYGANGLLVKFTVDAKGRLTNAVNFGFYGATDPGQITVTGAKGGNVALANLLTALATYGLIVDATT